jgi:hypothetical protein
VGPAVFNVGQGTTNVTLKPVRIVVDYGPNPLAPAAPDGGVVLELFATAGSPEALPASSDSYVDVAEDGTVTVTSVPNGDPAPALALGFVRFYILVTDGVELTTAELAPGVAPFPCLGPTVGIASAVAGDITTQTLEVAGAPAELGEGYNVPDGKTSTIGDSTSTTFGDSATISGGSATVPSFEGYELGSEKAATGNRQLHHLGGEPRWNDGDDDYIHHGTEPWGPVASFPPLNNFGPTSVELDGPSVSVTLTGTAFVFIAASGAFLGTAADTVVGIRIEVNGVDVYDETFDVFNTQRPLSWSVNFAPQEGAGTFDVKIKFRRAAGAGSVNLDSSSIFAMPF